MGVVRKVIRRVVVKRKRPVAEVESVTEAAEQPVIASEEVAAGEDEALNTDLKDEMQSLLSAFSQSTRSLLDEQRRIASGEVKGSLDISSPLPVEASDMDPTEGDAAPSAPPAKKARKKPAKQAKAEAAAAAAAAAKAKSAPPPKAAGSQVKRQKQAAKASAARQAFSSNGLFAPDDESD